MKGKEKRGCAQENKVKEFRILVVSHSGPLLVVYEAV